MTYLLSRRKAFIAAIAGSVGFFPGSDLYAIEYDKLLVGDPTAKKLIYAYEKEEKRIRSGSIYVYEKELTRYHRRFPMLIFRRGRVFPRGKWVKETGKWSTWTKDQGGVWEQSETTTVYERRQICDSRGCRWITVPVRQARVKRYNIKVRIKTKSTEILPVRQLPTYGTYGIPIPSQYWIYYGGNFGKSLRNHLVYHGLYGPKLVGLSDTDMRKLHSLAHNRRLDRYWYA